MNVLAFTETSFYNQFFFFKNFKFIFHDFLISFFNFNLFFIMVLEKLRLSQPQWRKHYNFMVYRIENHMLLQAC